MIEVNVSGDAEIDLLEGIEYYESKEEGLGLFFRHSVEILGGSHAMMFGLHRKLCKTFPYWIYYRMESSNSLTVVAIVGQRRGDEFLETRLGGA